MMEPTSSETTSSLWSSHGSTYWKGLEEKKRREELRKKAPYYIGGTAAVVLLIVGLWYGVRALLLSTAAPESDVAVSLEPYVATPQDLRDCVESTDQAELMAATCGKMCSVERNVLPRPTSYQACLSGCEAGIGTGWWRGCERRDDGVDACQSAVIGNCEGKCEPYAWKQPRPRLIEKCKHYCGDSIKLSCAAGKDWVDQLEYRMNNPPRNEL